MGAGMSEHHNPNVRDVLAGVENALARCKGDCAEQLRLLTVNQDKWARAMRMLEVWAAKDGRHDRRPFEGFDAFDLAYLTNEMARRRVALIASMKTEAA